MCPLYFLSVKGLLAKVLLPTAERKAGVKPRVKASECNSEAEEEDINREYICLECLEIIE